MTWNRILKCLNFVNTLCASALQNIHWRIYFTVSWIVSWKNMVLLLRNGRTRNSIGSGFSEMRTMGQVKSTHSLKVAHWALLNLTKLLHKHDHYLSAKEKELCFFQYKYISSAFFSGGVEGNKQFYKLSRYQMPYKLFKQSWKKKLNVMRA